MEKLVVTKYFFVMCMHVVGKKHTIMYVCSFISLPPRVYFSVFSEVFCAFLTVYIT